MNIKAKLNHNSSCVSLHKKYLKIIKTKHVLKCFLFENTFKEKPLYPFIFWILTLNDSTKPMNSVLDSAHALSSNRKKVSLSSSPQSSSNRLLQVFTAVDLLNLSLILRRIKSLTRIKLWFIGWVGFTLFLLSYLAFMEAINFIHFFLFETNSL